MMMLVKGQQQQLSRSLGVGCTPLIEFSSLQESTEGVRILAKAEWLNPGGSIKDRPALRMIQAALERGELRPGKSILDSTSGNTGIAYAWIGASLGYRVVLALPASVGPEKRGLLERYGAELILTDPLEGSDGAIETVHRLFEDDPESYFYPDQYNNPENWRAHYETTGVEILEQTDHSVTHFVAGVGTSGTFRGTGLRLKHEKPDARLISVQPASPLHGLEGLKHMGTSIVPGIYDPEMADENLFIETEEAQRMVRRVFDEMGLQIGASGGANLVAALRIARGENRGATVVTVVPDNGRH